MRTQGAGFRLGGGKTPEGGRMIIRNDLMMKNEKMVRMKRVRSVRRME